MKGLLVAIVMLFGMTVSAHAQSSCGPADTVAEKLESRYGELPVRRGFQDSNSVYEWWENPEKGTWTVLRRTADGKLCIMASGTNAYKPLIAEEPPEGDPA